MENHRLIELRKQAGMSQTELAEKIGVTQGMISSIEKGTKDPSRDHKINIAKLYGVSVEYLFYEVYYNLK